MISPHCQDCRCGVVTLGFFVCFVNPLLSNINLKSRMHPLNQRPVVPIPILEKKVWHRVPNNFPTWKKSFWYFAFVVACMQVKLVMVLELAPCCVNSTKILMVVISFAMNIKTNECVIICYVSCHQRRIVCMWGRGGRDIFTEGWGRGMTILFSHLSLMFFFSLSNYFRVFFGGLRSSADGWYHKLCSWPLSEIAKGLVVVICWSKFYKVKVNFWRAERGPSPEAWAEWIVIAAYIYSL
jgi:hypothetical protein